MSIVPEAENNPKRRTKSKKAADSTASTSPLIDSLPPSVRLTFHDLINITMSNMSLNDKNFPLPLIFGSTLVPVFPSLQILRLPHNNLTTIGTTTFPSLPSLSHLDLTSNAINFLPLTISHLSSSLSTAKLAFNNLTEEPLHLLSLPKLSKVELGGNPFLKGIFFARTDGFGPEVFDRVFKEREISLVGNKFSGLGSSGSHSPVTRVVKEVSSSLLKRVGSYDSIITTPSLSPPPHSNSYHGILKKTKEKVLITREFMHQNDCDIDRFVRICDAVGKEVAGNFVSLLGRLEEKPEKVGGDKDGTEKKLVLKCPPHTYDTFENLLKKRRLLPDQAALVVEKIGATLARLHQVGVCHGGLDIRKVLVGEEHLGIILLGMVEGDEVFGGDDGGGADCGSSTPSSFFYEKTNCAGPMLERCDARAYGKVAGDVARLLSQIYGDEEDLREETEEIVEDLLYLEEDCIQLVRRGGEGVGGVLAREGIYPRLRKIRPELALREGFFRWKVTRCCVGYLTAVIFTLTFLAAPLILIVGVVPWFWGGLYRQIFSGLFLTSALVSLLLPLREFPPFRKIGQLWYEMFSFRCNLSPSQRRETLKTQGEQNHMIMMHPHGIIPLHALLWSAYCDQNLQDCYGFGAAATIVGFMPFLRNIMGWLGAGDANYNTIKDGITEGKHYIANRGGRKPRHLFILPGGVAEVFHSEVGNNTIVFQSRRGLCRMALETGASLIPCYVFGATDFFHNMATSDSLLSRISRQLKGGLTYFWGWGGLPLPFCPKVTMTINDPIMVQKYVGGGKVPDAMVDALHGKYMESLVELFEDYKLGAGLKEEDILTIK